MFPQIIVTFESCQIIEYIAFRSQYCVTKTGRIDCQADNAIETIFEVEGQRLDFFFDACIEARISPVVEWIALVLGIEWVSLKQIMAGKRRDDSLQQKYILKLILQMQSMWAYNGQENPAEWIFLAKNYFGMRDNVEVTVAPPEQPLGDAQSAEQLAQKYQTALPKGIDVEYKEVAEEVVEHD